MPAPGRGIAGVDRAWVAVVAVIHAVRTAGKWVATVLGASVPVVAI
jgi:hypothetical protein